MGNILLQNNKNVKQRHMSKNRSIEKLIPSAILGVIIGIIVDIFLLISGLAEHGIIVNFGLILSSAVLTGVIILKYNSKTHKASITGTHTLSFIGMTIIQYTFTGSVKTILGI